MGNHDVNVVVKARDEASRTFGRIVKSAVGLGAVFLSFRAIKDQVADSISKYNEQEQAEKKLQQALVATGQAAGFSLQELKDYASQLQQVTTVGDETTIAAMSILTTFKEIKGDNFKTATELALDLSQAFEQDLKSSTMMVGKALNDPVKGLTALGRAGVQFTDDQKEMIKSLVEGGDMAAAQNVILEELAGQVGGQARAAVNTFSGAWTQLTNSIGDAKERAAAYLTTNQGIMNFMKTARVNVDNFSSTMSMMWAQAKLSIISTWEEFKYTFSARMPVIIGWFADNWGNIWDNMLRYTETVVSNMFINLKNFFVSVRSWVKGDGFDFTWVSLTDGFESTLAELPNIAKRQLTKTEQDLQKQVDELAEKLGTKIGDALTFDNQALNTSGGSGSTGPKDAAKIMASTKGPKAVESRFLGGLQASISPESEAKRQTTVLTRQETLQKQQLAILERINAALGNRAGVDVIRQRRLAL